MFVNSVKPMDILAILGVIFGARAYWRAKESEWLIGAALMGILLPYRFFMKPVSEKLHALNEKCNNSEIKEELTEEEDKNAIELLKSWVQRHWGRVGIALGAALAFYVAELKSVQDFKVSLNLK